MQRVVNYFCSNRISLDVVNASDEILIFLDNHAPKAVSPKMTGFFIFRIEPYRI